mgnify:CR=1 FL=1
MRSITVLLLTVFCTFSLHAQTSSLAEGQLFKLRVAEAGVYRLPYERLPAGTRPEDVRVLGFGNGMLPQPNSADRPETLPEVATRVVEQPDGSFELWFYAEGPDRIAAEVESRRMVHEKNLYDDHNYYFVSVGTGRTRAVEAATPPSGTPVTIRQFDDFQYYENEQYNLLNSIRRAPGGSGRLWLGEIFDFETVYDFPFDLSGHVAGTPVRITSRVMGYAFEETAFVVSADGTPVGTQEITPSIDSRYAQKGFAAQNTFRYEQPAGADFTVRLEYQKGNTTAVGFLDYLQVNAERELRLYGDQTRFRSFASRDHAVSEFVVENPEAAEVHIWDITVPQQATEVAAGNSSVLSFRAATQNQLREFIAFRADRLPEVEWIGEVENQDLRSVVTPDLLIFTPPVFREQAERLAEFRRNHDGLAVYVATLPEVYNEFASGRQDLTALRDFTRFLYQKNPEKLRYVLLFGDASYDPKNRTAGNTNFVPIYQSRDSFHPIYSYSSDDYLAFMEENEGFWAESSAGHHTLDLGVGRLPVRSVAQAQNVVNKLIRYTQTETLGNWRNRTVFVSDDGDRNIHQDDSEKLAQILETNYPEYLVERVYVDAFPQVADENDRRISPEARAALSEAVNEGAFIVNFMGHGSEIGWTSENILDLATIDRWRNPDRMPLFVTATCEFGRYDNPGRESGGERIILSPTGGGIALITTTRPVFSNTNFLAARAFYQNAFVADGRRLGDIMRDTKNNSLTLVNRNFALLGDPSMRLAYPEARVRLTDAPEQLRALETVTLKGEVVRNGQRLTGFNGTAEIQVFDAPANLRTLGDESDPETYQQFEHRLFNGEATVSNGVFSASFVVPEDVAQRNTESKITVYAYADEEDAHGATPITLGGTASTSPDDNPPQVSIFLDDSTFRSGATVPQDVLLLVGAIDENGFNPSGSDRQMLAILDGDEENPFVLNDYFQTQPNDFRTANIRFPLQDLPLGEHSLTVRLWDAHNNVGEATATFRVVEEGLKLEGGLAYPSPADPGDDVRFDFSHNRAGDDLEVRLDVVDRIGRLVYRQEETVLNAPQTIDFLRWPAPTTHIQAQGVYLYRITVNTAAGESAQRVGKIISVR